MASLLSRDWYRVSDLKPSLRQQVDMRLHHYLGKPWYVLFDRTSGSSFRMPADGYEVLRQFDGKQSIDAIWGAMAQDNHPNLPPQDEVIELIARLFESNLIQVDSPAKARRLHQLQREQEKQKWMQLIKSPISQRVPLIDPRPILDRTEWVARLLFGRVGFALLLSLMLLAGYVALQNWDGLTGNLADRVLAPDNLILMAFAYPLVKILHEFGHAWCVRRFGGNVTEMGVMFLLFIPIPYVDASQSNFFPSHAKRALVALSGILTELGIGALAILVWSQLDPGVGRAIAFNIIVICTISSVLFNGNPLLRFDAYYVLADLTQSPNLGNRGNAIVGHWTTRALGLPPTVTDETSPLKHQIWMAIYAIAAYCYRLFISFSIALLLMKNYPLVGQPLAVWALYGSILQPLYNGLKKLTQNTGGGYRTIVSTRLGLAALALGAGLFLVPLPKHTEVSGIVVPEKTVQSVSDTEGVLIERRVNDGDTVYAGQVIATVKPERLVTELSVLQAQQSSIEVKIRAQVAGTEAGLTQVLREELTTTQQSMRQLERQIANADVTSPYSGTWLWASPKPKPGAQIFRGQPLGMVDEIGNRQVLTGLPSFLIADFETGVKSIEMIDPTRPFDSNPLDSFTLVKTATHVLPDERLSSTFGGEVLTEPAMGNQPAKSVSPRAWLSTNGQALEQTMLGQRVLLRFKHPSEPAAPRLWRWAQRTFLGLLGPQ